MSFSITFFKIFPFEKISTYGTNVKVLDKQIIISSKKKNSLFIL